MCDIADEHKRGERDIADEHVRSWEPGVRDIVDEHNRGKRDIADEHVRPLRKPDRRSVRNALSEAGGNVAIRPALAGRVSDIAEEHKRGARDNQDEHVRSWETGVRDIADEHNRSEREI